MNANKSRTLADMVLHTLVNLLGMPDKNVNVNVRTVIKIVDTI
jgi:hypothetical protein